MNETRREIKLEPDYKALFRTMLAELKNQGQPRSMFGEILPAKQELEALRAVQRFIAPLAICSNSATAVVEIEELRTALADLSGEFCRFINELEAQLMAEDAADGFGHRDYPERLLKGLL